MPPRTIEVSRDDLFARRAKILAELGITSDELFARARSATLSVGEWEAVTELNDIAFLLGDADDDV